METDIKKYERIQPIVEKHFNEMAKDILEEFNQEHGDLSPMKQFRIKEIIEDTSIFLTHWIQWLENGELD